MFAKKEMENEKKKKKEKKEKTERFKKIFQQDMFMDGIRIWVDTQTGVNYLFTCCGEAGGLTPLLDSDGKPIVTPEIK